jgi:hypothetical protein
MPLTLFKNITGQLTDLEKEKLVPAMLLLLNEHSNDECRITNRGIMDYLFHCGYKTTEVRIRKMVNYIRVLNLANPKVLIGAANGYFLTSDIHTVNEQIESLRGRIDSMQAAIESIEAQKQNLKYIKQQKCH